MLIKESGLEIEEWRDNSIMGRFMWCIVGGGVVVSTGSHRLKKTAHKDAIARRKSIAHNSNIKWWLK